MPPGERGSTSGKVVDGDVPRRRRISSLFSQRRCKPEKIHPGNLKFERQVAEFQAMQLQKLQEQDQMAATIVGSLSFSVCHHSYLTLSDDHVEDVEITWNDDTLDTSTPPLPEDSTQKGKGSLLKDSDKPPPDDTDFLEGTFFKINLDKQKATTRNKKSSKKQKKKKGKAKGGRKQSHALEMQSETPTDPSSSSSPVAVLVPLSEYSSSSSSSSRVTEELIITSAINSASSGNEKELSASSSNNDDFKSFQSTTSYATAATSSVNDYAGSLSDARSERSLSASDLIHGSTDSRGFKKTSGEGNKPHVDQCFSLATSPGGIQEALLCSDYASNEGDFQKVVSRRSAKKMKKMQKHSAPSSTMAAPGPIITRELVSRAPCREVITIGHYINDDTFYGRKPNHKKGKYQKARSLSNLSKTRYTDGDNGSGSNTILVITTTVHPAKSMSSHHVTLQAITETNSPRCLPKEVELKTTAPFGDGMKDTESKEPSSDKSSDKLGSLANSSCANREVQEKAVALVVGGTEEKKEENRITFISTHASSSSELDKIIEAANNAYEIQVASDVYMVSGIHADIENFLHAATPVIGRLSCTKNISLQDQRLWAVWSWYEEPECCGIEVQMQGKKNSIWPEFSTYFRPLLSAVQLFGQSGKSQNHCGLVFEYFESDNPYSRPPIFAKIKQLRDGVNLSGDPIFGDPKQLESVKLSDLHPASWFSVAWYPICQIPAAAGSCQASFLTYHSLGKLVPQTCSTDKADMHDHIICPIVGLLGYKDQGENWCQLREKLIKFKATPNNVSSKTGHTELLHKRLRTLRQGASIMSKAVVPRASGEAKNNYHSDYMFFLKNSP